MVEMSFVSHTLITRIRLKELNILSAVFLYTDGQPVVAFLHQDSNADKHLVSYTINMKDESMTPYALQISNVEASAFQLIPVPFESGELLIIY
jgi:hypothetical protein